MGVKKKFKVKAPKIQPYYVATKDGYVCFTHENPVAVKAWKLAYGASVWKVTPKITKVRV